LSDAHAQIFAMRKFNQNPIRFFAGALAVTVVTAFHPTTFSTGFVAPAAAQAPAGAPETRLEPLTITTASGEHAFSVEVMRTETERARGLMYRRFMPADRGMLFDFKVEQPVMMWMKNTYMPLDMVFISRDGVVVNVAENTEPLSESIIPSNAPTYAVLELNAGVARRIGLKAGDKIGAGLFRKR
jgi:uncharacterized membrane protein (UPF0127 family)